MDFDEKSLGGELAVFTKNRFWLEIDKIWIGLILFRIWHEVAITIPPNFQLRN